MTTKPVSVLNVAVGTWKKSQARIAAPSLRRNARHVGEGGPENRTLYLSTVDFATLWPRCSSSLWIRGAPQSRFSRDSRRINSRTSNDTAGRPDLPCAFNFQKSLHPCLCQATTVAGWTKPRAPRHPLHTRRRNTQNNRSVRRSRGRGTLRFSTATGVGAWLSYLRRPGDLVRPIPVSSCAR